MAKKNTFTSQRSSCVISVFHTVRLLCSPTYYYIPTFFHSEKGEKRLETVCDPISGLFDTIPNGDFTFSIIGNSSVMNDIDYFMIESEAKSYALNP